MLYKKVAIKINKNINSITVSGTNGVFIQSFNGKDIKFTEKKLFFLTKRSYKNFLVLLNNFYVGVFYGYFIEINFIGLGSRFLRFKNYLLLKLGYSHYIRYKIPYSVLLIGYKRRLIIFGLDLQEINAIGKQLRFFKEPDIYKGKGIQIGAEVIKYKIGKKK